MIGSEMMGNRQKLVATQTAFHLAVGARYGLKKAPAKLLGSARTIAIRDVLAKLQALAGERHVSPYHFAYVYTGLGRFDEAMDWLEKAYEQRAGAIYGIKGSFLFRDLRSHPRFRALLAKMNLA